MNNYLKEIKAIFIFVVIGITIFGFPYLLVSFEIENYFYSFLLVYIILCVFFAILSSIVKNKILKKITSIILLPARIILTLISFIIPFGFLIIHLFYYVGLVVLIPDAILKLITVFDVYQINQIPTLTYIKFTSSVFIAVLFNYQLRKLIYKISPARIKSSKKLKPYELDKLTDYMLSENNVRFLIYSLYVILLIITNYTNFEEKYLSINISNDKAILQSFVTFIAFDRALTLLKQLEFKPSDFLNKIIKSITNKFKDLEQKTAANTEIINQNDITNKDTREIKANNK